MSEFKTLQIAIVTIAMVIGNFAYQIGRIEPDYWQASERSLFQIVAVFVVWLFVLRGGK